MDVLLWSCDLPMEEEASGKQASLTGSRLLTSLPILRANSWLHIDSMRSDAYYPQPMLDGWERSILVEESSYHYRFCQLCVVS